MTSDSKDLIAARSAELALSSDERVRAIDVRGLDEPARWSAYGAALGVSATAMVTLVPAVFAQTLVVASLCATGSVIAAVAGAVVGRRWHRMVSRERGRLTVAQLLPRLGVYGAFWATSVVWGVLLGAVALGAPLQGVLPALVLSPLVAAPAGAITTSILGVNHVLDLTRGHMPWKSLVIAAVLGPSAMFVVVMFLIGVANMIGLG
ncbi:MAG: hypothetical protein AAF449_05895 [Myxococcota bacterium]